MSKRFREDGATDRPPKRPRPDQPRQAATTEDIQFARQLSQLLTFRQDGIDQLLHGVRSFKAFLESILYHRDEEDRARQLSILREYLDSEKPADEHNDTERPFLGQLWQAWSFAAQNNTDHLASSVSAIFALLLRTLAGLLDFRDQGLLLCRTVLQHQHLRLVKRGLDAPKHKEFVISPCLRLATEVTSFDGGVLAREIYKRREQTFDVATLRWNLGLLRTDIPDEEVKRKPSVRTLTVRYVLAHLKYQHEGAKIDMLKSRPLCIALFQQLRDDPRDLVDEILTITEQNVLKNNELPRSAKATLLTQHNLERVTDVATRSIDENATTEKAFTWLKAVSTTQSYGILRPSGWYPPGSTKDDANMCATQGAIDLGLDSLEWYDSTDRPDVRNTTLLAWIQTLRPHADPKERELVITCFETAPELVAAYFAEKNMQLDPKLSNTWVGYASFLFEVMRLAVPTHLGNADGDEYASLPPQTNIVLENLLPRPLSQKVLTRCLNQSSELITFFAVRLLVLAFQKLRQVAAEMHKAAEASAQHRALWQEASEGLMSRFTERAPFIKDVISVFRKTPDDDDHALQREAITRLLRLYYEVTPVQALEESFDVSAPVALALARSKSNVSTSQLDELRAFTLQHLLSIAQRSPGMRWLNKQGTLQYSPLITLLKLHADDHQDRQMRGLLLDILRESSIVHDDDELDSLVASLLGVHTDDVWGFLEDCIGRASRQPVKYVDQLEAVTKDHARIGLLPVVVVEQASFVAKKPVVMAWIHRFLGFMCQVPTPSRAAVVLRDSLAAKLPFPSEGDIDADANNALQRVRLPALETVAANADIQVDSTTPALPFTMQPAESDNHPELLRWAQKDLEIAIQDGDVDALILCLCSSQGDVRRQAHAQLRRLGTTIRSSAVEDKDQLYVLLGELLESYEQQCVPNDRALPYLAGTFAARAVHVLTEPTHFLYPKLNRFLMRAPEWRINKLPNHWLGNTILSQRAEDDAYWKEVRWVLDWLSEGLQSPADLEIVRRGGVAERIMAVYSSPAASVKLVREKVMEILFRATCVEGGSDMLITRAGVLAWLGMMEKGGEDMAALMKRRVLASCDRERIARWCGVDLEVV